MKYFSLYCLLVTCLFLSCNRGVYVNIDNKKYNYGKNILVTFRTLKGTTPGYMFDVKAFKRSGNDSSFFLIGAGKSNIPITVGDYSFPNSDRINFSTSSISFYDNYGNRYISGGDEIYGPTFIITSLSKKRAKGWFKSKLVDIKADTVKPSNTITVEGRFNVSVKNAQHY